VLTYFLGRVPMEAIGTISKKWGYDYRPPFLLLEPPVFEEILICGFGKGGVEQLAAMVKNPLSNELKVAAEIFGCQERGEKVWLGKLLVNLKGEISKNTVSAALDTLFDWGIIKAEYGETEKGRAGRLLMISNESVPLIKELYEKYWKNR
jgi:hypothetical protein